MLQPSFDKAVPSMLRQENMLRRRVFKNLHEKNPPQKGSSREDRN